MQLKDEVELLRRVPMFAQIAPSKLKLLAFTSDRVSYRPGEVLFNQGDPGDAAYVVLSGTADVLVSAGGAASCPACGERFACGTATAAKPRITAMNAASMTTSRAPGQAQNLAGGDIGPGPIFSHGRRPLAHGPRAAQQAEYIEDRLKDVPPDLKERYFRQNGSRFRLVPELREMVTFLQGDITRTTEYVPSDLVVCRNTLIYFTRPDQEKILHGVADILPPGGILVLGKSETLVGAVRQRFEAICPVERIYRRL